MNITIEITLIIAIIFLIGAYIYFFCLFKPEPNIYYVVNLFKDPYRWFANTGDVESGSLKFIFFPFENVPKFPFEFDSLVTNKKAEKRGWDIAFDIPDDLRAIVQRNELVPGYLNRELHPIKIEFYAEGVDLFIIVLAVYQPLDPIIMRKKTKNWLELGNNHTGAFINTWGRKQKPDDVLNADIDKIKCGATIIDPTLNAENKDLVAPSQKAEMKEKPTNLVEAVNAIVIPYGFKMVDVVLVKIGNGKKSQDYINSQEAIRIAANKAKENAELRKAQTELAMVEVDVFNKETEISVKAVNSVTESFIKLRKQQNVTAGVVSENLGKHNGNLYLGAGTIPGSENMEEIMLGNILGGDFTKNLKFNPKKQQKPRQDPDQKQDDDKKKEGKK